LAEGEIVRIGLRDPVEEPHIVDGAREASVCSTLAHLEEPADQEPEVDARRRR
jgi:hypothetical protein